MNKIIIKKTRYYLKTNGMYIISDIETHAKTYVTWPTAQAWDERYGTIEKGWQVTLAYSDLETTRRAYALVAQEYPDNYPYDLHIEERTTWFGLWTTTKEIPVVVVPLRRAA